MPKIVKPPTTKQQQLIDAVENARLDIEQAKKRYNDALKAVVEAGVSLTQLERYVGVSKQALAKQMKKVRL